MRTRVIQTLFAYYQDGEKTPLTAKKDLLKQFADSYALYMQLLDFVNELTVYAEEQIESAIQRSKATHQRYEPNRRFVNNQFAQQVFNNHTLRAFVENEKLSWNAGMNATAAIYRQLVETDWYKDYMTKEECTYEDDKRIWRLIFSELIPTCPEMETAMEELEVVLDRVNWAIDLQIIDSYVVKSIKHFKQATGSDQELLQMFDTEEEVNFAKDLLRYAIENRDQYLDMMTRHLKNWDADRVAYMDKIILQTALAEIINFPNIALEISLNEYIEIAKEYSGEKSHFFINGILNEILQELKRNNQLIKTATLR